MAPSTASQENTRGSSRAAPTRSPTPPASRRTSTFRKRTSTLGSRSRSQPRPSERQSRPPADRHSNKAHMNPTLNRLLLVLALVALGCSSQKEAPPPAAAPAEEEPLPP